jgi:hypothetical protein
LLCLLLISLCGLLLPLLYSIWPACRLTRAVCRRINMHYFVVGLGGFCGLR